MACQQMLVTKAAAVGTNSTLKGGHSPVQNQGAQHLPWQQHSLTQEEQFSGDYLHPKQPAQS